MAINTNFPNTNYASSARGLDSGTGDSISPAISIPRPKYTWFAEFYIQPGAMTGSFNDGFSTGRIMAALKSVNHPEVEYDVEKLRSYNNVRVVPTRLQYKPFTIVFIDDTTSYVADLMKSYRRFYHYSGDADGANDFGDGVGQDGRQSSVYPSMGMKLRSNGRHFFTRITIYDLGTATNSVNVYHIINPVMTSQSWEQLDYYESAGMTNVTLSFEYEGFFEEVGKDVSQYSSVFQQISGASTSIALRGGSAGLDLFGDSEVGSILNQVAGNVINNAPSILSDTFANGQFNSKALKTTLFQSAARGTPIQDVRNAITGIQQGSLNLNNGNPVGVLGNLTQVGGSAGNLSKIGIGNTGVATTTWSSSNSSTKSAADMMRGLTNWAGFD